MFKPFMSIALLFFSTVIFGQSLKPIPQMVLQAKANQEFLSLPLLRQQADQSAERAIAQKALKHGTLLAWDATKTKELLTHPGEAVSLTLPWENGSSITLDLVPAKNLSGEFQVRNASSGGLVFNADKGQHYWGIVQNNPASLVTISVFDGEIMGQIEYNQELYTIGLLSGTPDKTHILYKNSDLIESRGPACETDDVLHKIGDNPTVSDRSAGPDNCVRMYVETDYTLFQNKGSVANVTSYMTGVFNQVTALYANESVNVVLHELFVWDVVDPYTGPSAGNYLTQFRDELNGVYNGDLAHLVGINNLGGVAYLDVLCNSYWGVGYSSIYSTYSDVPTYSWTIEVITHEIGHNLGSPHTHACAWNGNNTAIDGCGPTAGYSEGCNGPLPTNGGTIMSYCHLLGNIGINFNNGFGPQPGDLIRDKVYNAACLTACGGGGCNYVNINSNNFESGFGIWTDGGTDCVRTNNASFANSPTYSILLRDNTNTSLMTTNNQNWVSYDELTIDFSYYAVSFENGEDFWLQISTNGGASYTTVGDYNAGTQFSNGVHTSGQVVIAGPFTANTRLRFRADASADDDRVYIDDVVITGCQQPGFNGSGGDDRNDMSAESLEQAGVFNFLAGPNPVTDQLNIQFEASGNVETTLQLVDLAGRTVAQETVNATEGPNGLSMPMNHLANGLYLLQVRAGEESFTIKVVVAK